MLMLDGLIVPGHDQLIDELLVAALDVFAYEMTCLSNDLQCLFVTVL